MAGDHLAAIAEEAGFRSADTVWDAGENADLRALRDNPSVLAPGDQLFVPDKQGKEISRSIDSSHRFVAKIDKLLLKIMLTDFDNAALSGLDAVLSVEGSRFELVTDGDGAVQQKVPRSARTGHLTVADLGVDIDLQIGDLDPPDMESGWKARLINLGYYRGAHEDDDDTVVKFWGWALEEFQCDQGLPVTGEADGATIAALNALHES